MPQNEPSKIIKAGRAVVSVGASLASMEECANVFVNSVGLRLAPHFSTAVLAHPYGEISFNGGNKFNTETTLDLREKFVSVSYEGAEIFRGLIVSQTDTPGGTRYGVPSGENIYTAYSLDYLLDRVYVTETYTLYRGTPKTPHSFNGEGHVFEKNRSAQDLGNANVFDWSSDAEEWSALDIIRYLLAFYGPDTGVAWALSGCHASLSKLKLQLNPRGKSVRQCVAELVRPEYGFSFMVVPTDSGAELKIVSVSDADMQVDGETIVPANTDVISINDNIEFSRSVSSVTIEQAAQSSYSEVRVYSEPIRVNATFRLGDNAGGLVSDWTDILAASYKAASDYDRHKDEFETVYSRFKLGEDWDKCDWKGNPVVPILNEESMDLSFGFTNPFAWETRAFERTFPVNLSSSDSKKKTKKKPFVLLNTGTEATPKYIVSERVAYSSQGEERPSVGLHVLDDAPGIQLKPPYPHLLGKTFFDGKSDYEPMFDFSEALFSGSIYTDTPLACRVQGAALPGGVSRVKEIYVPNLHLWVTLPDTMTDATTAAATFRIERDDRNKIKAMAAAAKAWYGRLRNLVAVVNRGISVFPYLGYVIDNMYSGGAFTPIGTVISAIDYNFLNGSRSVSTDFCDFDFSRVSRRAQVAGEKDVSRRISRLEQAVSDIPLRSASGGGPSSGSPGGPFSVVRSGDTSVKVLSYNSDEGRLWESLIYAGLEKIAVTETELAVSADGGVWLELSHNGSAYAYELKSGSLPEQSADKVVFPLAWVSFADGKISTITQLLSGILQVAGRVV